MKTPVGKFVCQRDSVPDNCQDTGAADQVVDEGDARAAVHFGGLIILALLELAVTIDEGVDLALQYLALADWHQLHAGIVAADLLDQLVLFAEAAAEGSAGLEIAIVLEILLAGGIEVDCVLGLARVSA